MLSLFCRMAWKNVLLNRKKSGMAVLAVALCYFALNVFQGYILGAEGIFEDSYAKRSMLGDLLIRRQGLAQMLSTEQDTLIPKDQQQALEKILASLPATDLSLRALRVTGTYGNGHSQAVFTGLGFEVRAGEEMRAPGWKWDAVAGRPLSAENEQVLLGQGLGGLLGCRASSQERFITGQGGYEPRERPFVCEQGQRLQVSSVTLQGQANSIEVEVAGLVDAMFRELDLRFTYLPLSLAQRLLDTDSVSFFAVRLKPGASVGDYVKTLNAAFAQQGLALEAESWKDDPTGEFYRKTMSFLHVFRNFMVIVILGVALLSIFNTFLRNVQDRTREIGVLRTLGFRVREVRLLFFLETLYLAGLGILGGGLAALLGAVAINRAGILYKIGLLTQPVPFVIQHSPWMMVGSVVVVVTVTLGAVAIPLYRSEKRKITESLSYV